MYWDIAAVCAIVIVSYAFSILSAKTRIPSVLMLLVLGILLRQGSVAAGLHAVVGLQTLQFLGVLGLIVILLDAGLDLSLSRQKAPLIRRAVLSSLVLLLATAAGSAAILHFAFGQSLLRSIITAVPLAVISSTIVASSIDYLAKDTREFLTYESALSDIFGILLFNFLVGSGFGVGLIAFDAASLVIAVVASVAVSIVLVFLLAKVRINVKAFLIFAVLVLIYAVGYTWRLPTLLTVLIFGLIINNWRVSSFRPFHRYLRPGDVEAAAETVKSVTAEAAFLVRTMFFVLFGYTIDIRELWDARVIGVGTAIVACTLALRYLYLRFLGRGPLLPEVFYSPRGLTTVVLMLSIPASLSLPGFGNGVVFFVVMLSTIVMTVGSLFFTPPSARREGTAGRARRRQTSPVDL